ncbi:hypothetical protein [Kribbella sp. CA-293567]|uniref:hypothetical protein n=1 Tax=Kribbella sp. CA-293567 TaxID=3002436 RepID=UPI0022DE7BED|nr:hypothetical protein [Kribbella sp. CA-293567]WBQ08209.1 hypothetical protein OX958_15705 [Kribbella sp. CA-293567]
MRRLFGWCGVGCLLLALTAGCGDPDQQLRSEGARAARDAASAVGAARVAGQAYLDRKLWSQPATRMVGEAEEAMEQVVSTFGRQQPKTPESRQTYDRFTEALEVAEGTLTDLRIALTNGDTDGVGKLVRQLTGTAAGLRELGETEK